MTDCRDYKEILQGESLDSSDSSSDWEESLGSGDTWSTESTDDSSQDSFLVSSSQSSKSSENRQN